MSLDGKISAALIFAIALETMTALVWAGAAAERLSNVEARLFEQRPLAERLARVEAEISAARAQLGRIERKMDDEAKP
ncbi:MAG: hypothetical protein AAGB25_06500 [Pseudomonadota bacterium]